MSVDNNGLIVIGENINATRKLKAQARELFPKAMLQKFAT